MPHYIATIEAHTRAVDVPVTSRFVATQDMDGHEVFLVVINKRVHDLTFEDRTALFMWVPTLKQELAAESYHPDFIRIVGQHVALIRKQSRDHKPRKPRSTVTWTLRQLQRHDID